MNEDAIALRLGRLVIACARVEFQVSQLSEFLATEPQPEQRQGEQIKSIRRTAIGRPDGDEIRKWADQANALLRERGTLVHGSFLGRWQSDQMRHAYIDHKRGQVVDIDIEDLDRLVATAAVLAQLGRDYSSRVFGEFIDRLGGEYVRE